MHASLMDARSGQLMRALSLVEHGVEVLREVRDAEKSEEEEEAEMVSLDLCGRKNEEDEKASKEFSRMMKGRAMAEGKLGKVTKLKDEADNLFAEAGRMHVAAVEQQSESEDIDKALQTKYNKAFFVK